MRFTLEALGRIKVRDLGAPNKCLVCTYRFGSEETRIIVDLENSVSEVGVVSHFGHVLTNTARFENI